MINGQKVKFAVTEALAILHSKAGKEIDVLALVEGLDRSENAEETVSDLKARFDMPASTLPSMNSSGHVQYTITGNYAPPPTPLSSNGNKSQASIFKDDRDSDSKRQVDDTKNYVVNMGRSRSANPRRHPSAGRVSSRKIPFHMPRGQRAGKTRYGYRGYYRPEPKRKSSPPQIVGKKQASTAIGTERVEEGRVWRQKDHIERSLNELKGRDGAPFLSCTYLIMMH